MFGKLVDLPRLAEANRLSIEAASNRTNQLIAPFRVLDIQTATIESLEAAIAPIRVLRAKLATTEQNINKTRMPYTQKMNEIISVFTGAEKEVHALFDMCKNADDDLQREISRRNKEAAEKNAKDLRDKQDKIDKVAAITKDIHRKFAVYLTETVVAMHTKFYTQSIDALPAFVKSLSGWTPSFSFDAAIKDLTGEIDLIGQARLDTKRSLETEFVDSCISEREKLVDMLAGRLEQLKEMPEATIEPPPDISFTADDKESLIDDEVSKNKMNAAFETTTQAVVISSAKGKTVKQKYVVETHEAMKVLMQSWVTYNFPLLSVEELNTKLSFIRTAASERLNAGHPILEAKGLSVVEDIRTKTQR